MSRPARDAGRRREVLEPGDAGKTRTAASGLSAARETVAYTSTGSRGSASGVAVRSLIGTHDRSDSPV